MKDIMQEIFDKVVTHIFTQRRQARFPFYDGGPCAYRMDGLKCAFGIFIPDDKYTPDMEEKSASAVIKQWPDIFPPEFSTPEIQNLITQLQLVHDRSPNWYSKANMVSALNEVARNYSLDITIVEKFKNDDTITISLGE